MNKKVTFQAFMCVALAVAVCAPLSAGAFLRGDLDLTDQQKTELKAIAAAAHDDIAPYVEELKSLKAAMEEIIVSDETIVTEEGADACKGDQSTGSKTGFTHFAGAREEGR